MEGDRVAAAAHWHNLNVNRPARLAGTSASLALRACLGGARRPEPGRQQRPPRAQLHIPQRFIHSVLYKIRLMH